MRPIRFCLFAVAVACLALPTAGLAAPAGAEPIATLAGTTTAVAAPAVLAVPARAAERPDAADAFEVRVDRLVQAAVEKAVLPALRAQAAAEAAQDTTSAPRVVYLQAPTAQEAGPTMLGLSWADFLKLAGMILTGIAAVLFPLIFKASADAKKAEYGRWAVWAYHAVQEFAALTPNKLDDLAAQGLAVVAGVLAPGVELNQKELAAAALYSQRLGEKGLSLTAPALADAKAMWKGISGEEKTEAAVRAKAVALAAASESAARPQTPLAA